MKIKSKHGNVGNNIMNVKKNLSYIWEKADNRKRITGIILAIIGCLAKQVPIFDPIADPLIYGGLAIGGIGSAHAVRKEYNRKQNGGVNA